MICNYLRWYLLLFISQCLLNVAKAQLGFVCEGLVEFRAELINQASLDDLDTYTVPKDIDTIEACARTCYIKEFCRSAVFNTRTKNCKHSYDKGYCRDDVVRVRAYNGLGNAHLTCIKCQNGQRVQDRRVSGRISTSRTVVAETPVASGLSRTASASSPRLLHASALPRTNAARTAAAATRGSFGRSRTSGSRFGVKNDQRNIRIPTQADFDRWSQSCFVGVRQNVILGGGFAVERGVTLLECQCLCAQSWQSGRYDIQCKAVMYYPTTSECVLSQQNKLNRSHPLVQVDKEYQVNYYDFTCHRTEREIGNFIENVCQYAEAPPTTTVATIPDSKVSDMCYVEVKEHLLRGSAVAIQSRISLKECKCLCASSHEPGNSLNFQCMSVMYYYDEEFCILNSDNRLRRPDLFLPDVTTYTVTYYGFSCESNVANVNVYMTEHCGNTTSTDHTPHLKN